jgi:ABC-type Mn2+/Zn2+ transport system permease subunit
MEVRTAGAQPHDSERNLLISYLSLRKAVGVLGVTLPLLLVVGNWRIFHTQTIEDSISYYYYTGMRGVFVGVLWAIGIFLMSYRGYEKRDAIAGRLACFFALGVALFPTARVRGTCDIVHLFTVGRGGCDTEHVVSFVHATFASLLFLTLAYFSLFLFTETGPNGMTKRKRERNVVYYLCGGIILASMVGILVLYVGLGLSRFGPIPVLFGFESMAVVSFGVSWLIKGEFVLKDQ